MNKVVARVALLLQKNKVFHLLGDWCKFPQFLNTYNFLAQNFFSSRKTPAPNTIEISEKIQLVSSSLWNNPHWLIDDLIRKISL